MEEYNLSPYHNQQDNMSNIPVTPLMINHLQSTKPWVRFISIVMFIFSGLTFIGGLAVMLIPTASGAQGPQFGFLIGILYILMGGLYLAPAYFLHQYASSIQDLLRGGGDTAMEMALGSQKSFWRFMGILTLIVICLYALIFLFMIVGAVSMFR